MKQLLITIAAVMLVGCGPRMSIHEAAKAGNIEVIKQHLAAGADLDAQDRHGVTVLYHAAEHGHKEIVERLITNGADVNAKDQNDVTPLHRAAFAPIPLYVKEANLAAVKRNSKIVELLIDKGADVNATCQHDETLLDLAESGKFTEIADLLRKNGAKTRDELQAVR